MDSVLDSTGRVNGKTRPTWLCDRKNVTMNKLKSRCGRKGRDGATRQNLGPDGGDLVHCSNKSCLPGYALRSSCHFRPHSSVVALTAQQRRTKPSWTAAGAVMRVRVRAQPIQRQNILQLTPQPSTVTSQTTWLNATRRWRWHALVLVVRPRSSRTCWTSTAAPGSRSSAGWAMQHAPGWHTSEVRLQTQRRWPRHSRDEYWRPFGGSCIRQAKGARPAHSC